MSANINAPNNTITNRDGVLLAYNSFHAPGGSIYIGGERASYRKVPYLVEGNLQLTFCLLICTAVRITCR